MMVESRDFIEEISIKVFIICTRCKFCDASHSPAKYTFKRVPRTQALMSAIEAVLRSSAQTGEAGMSDVT